MDVGEFPVRLNYDDLRNYTDDFSDENYIGEFQFGKVYHGKIPLEGLAQPKPVTVKIWEIPTKYYYVHDDNENRVMDEVVLLKQPAYRHPGLMKLYGFCPTAGHWGVVYDFKSYNTVHNLLLSDDFKWSQRIKVALEFARVLKFLHRQDSQREPLIIKNICAANIMVDKDFNPKLYDFGMVTCGIFADRRRYKAQHVFGTYGYKEPCYYLRGAWTTLSDVYAFGTLLLCMMTKQFYDDEERKVQAPTVGRRLYEEYGSDDSREGVKKSKTSLVLKCFESDPWFCATDAPKITRLAIRCVEFHPRDRPTMKDIVRLLQKLQIIKRHLDVYGAWTTLSDVYAFGTLLLCMMRKTFYTDEENKVLGPSVGRRLYEEYGSDDSREGVKKSKTSLVLKCFEGDPWFCATDAPKITRLAIRCVEFHPLDRLAMKDVVRLLQKLQIVKRHLDFYGEISESSIRGCKF